MPHKETLCNSSTALICYIGNKSNRYNKSRKGERK